MVYALSPRYHKAQIVDALRYVKCIRHLHSVRQIHSYLDKCQSKSTRIFIVNHVSTSNVKTVKSKRSTNVLISDRNETQNVLVSFPNLSYPKQIVSIWSRMNLLYQKRSFRYGQGEQILDQIKTI